MKNGFTEAPWVDGHCSGSLGGPSVPAGPEDGCSSEVPPPSLRRHPGRRRGLTVTGRSHTLRNEGSNLEQPGAGSGARPRGGQGAAEMPRWVRAIGVSPQVVGDEETIGDSGSRPRVKGRGFYDRRRATLDRYL